MTAPLEVRLRDRESTLRAETFRELLLSSRREQTAEFARHAATLARLAANSSDATSGFDRAMAAIRLYQTRQAIEDIEDALSRIDAVGPSSLSHPPVGARLVQVAASTPASRLAVCSPQHPGDVAGRALEKASPHAAMP
jgi:hypothetical protein